MDPNTGKLYPSMEAAQAAMDALPPGRHRAPLEIIGEALAVEELSRILQIQRAAEKKARQLKKRAKRKKAKQSRKQNR